MKWKYGLIKIEHPSVEDDYCELVELFQTGASGEYDAFCKARINSIQELNSAYEDVEKDGVNYWFSKNGTFSAAKGDNFWDWERNTPSDDLDESLGNLDDDMELYAVYGGD
tara:strand:+ start:12214 stop:12546 length:333 start_codon:yes stop_codon:yes gene_type:complete